MVWGLCSDFLLTGFKSQLSYLLALSVFPSVRQRQQWSQPLNSGHQGYINEAMLEKHLAQ